MTYISLHNHTMYSMMASIIKPQELIDRAVELEMKFIAVTDNHTLGGIWDSYKAAKKSKVKLIVGCQHYFIDNVNVIDEFNNDGEKKDKPDLQGARSLVLLAKNQIGYKNILSLNRYSFDHKFAKIPFIDWNLLEKYSEGVICLTGDASGILSYNLSNGNKVKAIEDAKKLKEIFEDDLALELQPNNLRYNNSDQMVANRMLSKISKDLDIKAIAASGARYLKPENDKILDLVMAIKGGRSLADKSRQRFDLPQLYLHTREDVVNFFKRNYGEEFGNILCDNTMFFAEKCEKPEWIKPEVVTGDKIQLPTFPVKDVDDYSSFKEWANKNEVLHSLDEDKQYMRYWCEKNWNLIPKDKEEIYKKRYEDELKVYESLGFSSYMLITADFIDWSLKNDISAGPGRGSAGGSLVA